ncbi:hypothetical protein SAMN05443633_104240 [Chryseobacterium arachidis]|uniref:Uncharacterized protein n=2 Tax=Chryseobacterium arachidis TaxID=1416778 RepID=A0A1M5BNU5_9FLAO|nr:hypothetical protein SAMN05443633_104240 [Chryseobacterium arachidis]
MLGISCKKKDKAIDKKIKDTISVSTDSVKTKQEEISLHSDNSEDAKSDLDYQQVNENDFKKWKGEYLLDYIDYAGENDGTKLKAKLTLDSNEDGHFYVWYETPNDTAKIGMHHVYGSFGRADDRNTAIKFLPMVIVDGENTGIDLDYFLYSKDGKFFIKSDMILSEDGNSRELPIQKIK